jgi:hypothetical protein
MLADVVMREEVKQNKELVQSGCSSMNTCLKKGNVVKYLKSEFNGLPYGQ